jgi:hypothetical protein
MAFETIMAEVEQLNLASDRIEGLAEHHLPVSEAHIHRRKRSRNCNGVGSAG